MLVRQGVFLNAQSRGMLTLFMRVISSIVWLGRDVCVVSVGSDYDLAKTNAMLEMFQHDDAGYTTIKERELREALGNCVTAVKSDPLNHSHTKKLLGLLQLVTDDRQRLALFEDVEKALVKTGDNFAMREAAGLLGATLADAMDSYDGRVADPAVQEAFFRHSIRTFPESPVAARSLGYKLEQRGQELQAVEIYREGLARGSPERLDLRLLLASCCSPFLDDGKQSALRFSRVSGEIQSLVHDIQTSGTPYRNVPSPGRDLVYIPSFSWPYLGQNMRPLMEGLCWIFAAMTVGLHKAAAGLDPRYGWNNHPSGGVADETSQHSKRTETNATASHTRPGRDGRIVVGIVMERRGNHSPHRLIQGVLEGMDRSKFRLVVFSRDYVADYPAAGQAILQAAEEVVIFEWHPFVTGLADPFADRRLVEQAQVDVLLYAALGNTLWSHLLALGRLAPVQMAFGHGHPVTSGSPGVDYLVSSELFETAASIDGREIRRITGTASDISAATGVEAAVDDEEGGTHHNGSSTFARSTPSGTFGRTDTTAFHHDRRHPHGNLLRTGTQPILQEERKYDDHGSHQQWQGRGGDGERDYTEQLVLFDSLTASLPEVVGPAHAPSSAVTAVLAAARASSPNSAAFGLLQEGDHMYHCIQHSKKFHPDFDPVLRGVLQSDPAAKILLSAASEVHLPRWERILGSDLSQRLVFLPYLAHSDMLTVVANCRVMLDTFPWGAGVTSMESLLVGVPIVTLPARISVLPLASGQLVELGVEGWLVASDVDDMVKKAVKLASDSAYRETVSATILHRKDRLSNPYRALREWERFLERAVRSAVHFDAKL